MLLRSSRQSAFRTLAIVLCVGSAVWSFTTRYVPSTQYPTLAQAVAASSTSDHIVITANISDAGTNINVPSLYITSSGSRKIISLTSTSGLQATANGVYFYNLEIRGCQYGNCIYISSAALDVNVRSCVLKGPTGSVANNGIYADGNQHTHTLGNTYSNIDCGIRSWQNLYTEVGNDKFNTKSCNVWFAGNTTVQHELFVSGCHLEVSNGSNDNTFCVASSYYTGNVGYAVSSIYNDSLFMNSNTPMNNTYPLVFVGDIASARATYSYFCRCPQTAWKWAPNTGGSLTEYRNQFNVLASCPHP